MSKGKGWHGNSYGHSLASKGVRTSYGIKKGNIVYLPSSGLIRELDSKLTSPYAKGLLSFLKGKITKFKEARKVKKEEKRLKKSEELAKKEIELKKKKAVEEFQREKKAEIKKLKKETGVRAKVSKLLEKTEESQSRENLRDIQTAEIIGDKPAQEEIDISERGELGAFQEKVSATEHKPPEGELDDVTIETMESVDADSIIKVSENKEKLIAYKNEVKRDIDTIDSIRGRLERDFNELDRATQRRFNNDRDLKRSNLRSKIENIQTTGQPRDETMHKINELKIEHEREFSRRWNEIKAEQMQHKADVGFAVNMREDLSRLHRQVNKRVQTMVASGKRK